jgi:hypothetical protein
MRRSYTPAPRLLAELGAASAETIARRMMLMGTGQCTRAEYRKMVDEKVAATQSSWMAMAFSPWTAWTSMLTPYHQAARRNARRLRRKSLF